MPSVGAGVRFHPSGGKRWSGARGIVEEAATGPDLAGGGPGGRWAPYRRWASAAVARGGGCAVTIGGSIALIIIGAILKWGITWKPKNIDLEAIGVILMIGGVACLLVAIYFVVRRNRRTAGAQVYEERRYTEPPPPPPPPMGP